MYVFGVFILLWRGIDYSHCAVVWIGHGLFVSRSLLYCGLVDHWSLAYNAVLLYRLVHGTSLAIECEEFQQPTCQSPKTQLNLPSTTPTQREECALPHRFIRQALRWIVYWS